MCDGGRARMLRPARRRRDLARLDQTDPHPTDHHCEYQRAGPSVLTPHRRRTVTTESDSQVAHHAITDRVSPVRPRRGCRVPGQGRGVARSAMSLDATCARSDSSLRIPPAYRRRVGPSCPILPPHDHRVAGASWRAIGDLDQHGVGHGATVGPVLPLIQGVTEAPGVNSVPKHRSPKSLDTQA